MRELPANTTSAASTSIAAQPTPDQQFDFTVNVTDFDNDVVTSNEFSVGVDGTGVNDNDAVVFV